MHNSPFITPANKPRRPRLAMIMVIVTVFAVLGAQPAWAAIKSTNVKRVSGWTEVHDSYGDTDVSVFDVDNEIRCVLTHDSSRYGSQGVSCLSIYELEEARDRANVRKAERKAEEERLRMKAEGMTDAEIDAAGAAALARAKAAFTEGQRTDEPRKANGEPLDPPFTQDWLK